MVFRPFQKKGVIARFLPELASKSKCADCLVTMLYYTHMHFSNICAAETSAERLPLGLKMQACSVAMLFRGIHLPFSRLAVNSSPKGCDRNRLVRDGGAWNGGCCKRVPRQRVSFSGFLFINHSQGNLRSSQTSPPPPPRMLDTGSVCNHTRSVYLFKFRIPFVS